MTTSEPQLLFRKATGADASVLARAQRTVAAVPGHLVGQPRELSDVRLEAQIDRLADVDNGCFFVAETDTREIVAHGLLDPLDLAAVRHVVHLTLVVHPGWQGRGIGEAFWFLIHFLYLSLSNSLEKFLYKCFSLP